MRTGIWQTEKYRQAQSKRMREILASPEIRKHISDGTKLGYTPEVKAKLSQSRKGHFTNEETKQKISNSLKGYRAFRFNKGKKRGTKLGYKCSEQHKEKVKQKSLEQWRNPISRDKLVKAMLEMRSPNNMELQVLELLNTNFNSEWKFVGDGSLIINGLSPDFVNINGKKLIIEFFGRPWHKPQEEHYKEKTYAQLGYKTLVIWSEELSNTSNLILRIDNWLKGA